MTLPSTTQAERYADAVAIILHGFEFELCHECGQDIDRHVITPGPFGLPLASCLEVGR